MKLANRNAIKVFGTEKFLEWIKDNHKGLSRWTLANLNHHPNIYLVNEEDPNCWGNCFEDNFEKIFRSEVGEYVYDGVGWPKEITLELFNEWFKYEYSELVYDLSANLLETNDE